LVWQVHSTYRNLLRTQDFVRRSFFCADDKSGARPKDFEHVMVSLGENLEDVVTRPQHLRRNRVDMIVIMVVISFVRSLIVVKFVRCMMLIPTVPRAVM